MKTIYNLANIKKLAEMVELHDNINFKCAINNIDDLIYFTNNRKKSLVQISIECNNLEAYKLIINHKSIVGSHFNDHQYFWIYHVFNKYEKYKSLMNEQYINELNKTNILFSSVIINYIRSVDVLTKIIDKINYKYNDTTLEYTLQTILFNNNNEIREYMLDRLLTEKKQYMMINSNEILLNLLQYPNNENSLNILKKHNIEITRCDNKPSILFTHYYLYFSDCYYEDNLLNINNYKTKYFSFDIMTLIFVIDNLESLRKKFKEYHDDNYELFNHFVKHIMIKNYYNNG